MEATSWELVPFRTAFFSFAIPLFCKKQKETLSYVKIPATSGTTATLSIFAPFVAGNKTVERKLIKEKGSDRILSRDDSDDKEDSGTNQIWTSAYRHTWKIISWNKKIISKNLRFFPNIEKIFT